MATATASERPPTCWTCRSPRCELTSIVGCSVFVPIWRFTMSHQLLERIRDHSHALDEAAPPIRFDDVRSSTRHSAWGGPRLSLIAMAAAVVIIVGGLVAINATRQHDPSQRDAPPAAASAPADRTTPDAVTTPGYQLNVADA